VNPLDSAEDLNPHRIVVSDCDITLVNQQNV